ncbi:hypothetical protein M3G03_04430 [Aestuariimicrobium sp. p3-SID1156]|uniref:hypothetical protein n=1 Tax=Aestuariimicrobium sp. p3-SID1156 TaxID=2916038 RepID=UPI00223B0C89|nr:hypothetical protein [Aestuariimicrobium sp. p3-SID1156]MCT1458793.1 hypothetical protein [Aestuariimicrobium sp. p3-SID1156]
MGKAERDAMESALDDLSASRAEREQAEERELASVRTARQAGASWSRIGEIYGLTKQGAQQRFKQAVQQATSPQGRPEEAVSEKAP